jgi:hypothetical protein
MPWVLGGRRGRRSALQTARRHPSIHWRTRLLIEPWEPPRNSPLWFAFGGVQTERFAYPEYVAGEQELYDLQRDLFELRNLAANPADARW